jgi:hypothetical protein
MFFLLDLAKMSNSGRLRRQIPLGASCLDIAGSDGICSCIPMFFSTVWFIRERREALVSVATMGHYLFRCEVRGGEYHGR